MSTFNKAKLSGTTEGAPLVITAINSTGAQTIHTCATSSGTNIWDEMYVFAHSNDIGCDLTLEYGSTSAIIKQRISTGKGLIPLLPGTVGNGALVLKAFKTSSSADVLVSGWVNTIR